MTAPIRTFAVLLPILAIVAPAIAQSDTPTVSGEISIELQDDWNYKSDDRGNLNNSLNPTIEPSVTFQLSPRWSVSAVAVMESIGDPVKFENRLIEDVGVYVEDLFVEYAGDRFGAKAGKLNPGFGIGWDIAAGVYGTDFAEDYETSERIGVVASWKLAEGQSGTHVVSGSTFFADTTILSESAITGRGVTREEDGGVSNTESFSSFLIAVNGEEIPVAGQLGYHLSYMQQAKGSDGTADEHALAAAVYTELDLGNGFSFQPMVEGVRLINAGGVDTENKSYLVLSGQLGWNNWNLAIAHTERVTGRENASDDRDSLSQISAGYSFDFGLSIDVGWKIAEEANIETRTLGILAAYTLTF